MAYSEETSIHVLTVERFPAVSSWRIFTCSISLSLACTCLLSRSCVSAGRGEGRGLGMALVTKVMLSDVFSQSTVCLRPKEIPEDSQIE